MSWSLNCSKKNLDVSFKGCTCTDGWKQQSSSNKKYAMSSTVSLKLILIMATIGAHEKQYVAVIYVPGAFHNTDMDKEVMVVL